jgi:hypothetical protein
MSTTREQLEGAVLTLARSGTIKDRLADAFRKHLAQLSADDLPDGLRTELRACHDVLTREQPLRGEDAVRATVRKMSSEEADEVACRIVRLFGAMTPESQPEALPVSLMPVLPALTLEPQGVCTVNGARNGTLNAAIALNGALRAGRKAPKSVPQIISLYAGEA